MKNFSKYLVVVVTCLALACENPIEEPIIVNNDLDFFPIAVGYYQVFDMFEVTYQQGALPDTSVYEMKLEVVDSFMNTTGGSTYVLYRSERDTGSLTWNFRETVSVRINEGDIIVTEQNISLVPLSLPGDEGKYWDGNKYNARAADVFDIIAYDIPLVHEDTTYQNTLTVEQEFNDDPIVYTDIRYEVYQRKVGLISKETTQLHYCQEQNCNSNEVIEYGTILKQTIKEYGYR